MKTIFWNVDTQYDFMRSDGNLYVPEAEQIEGNLERLTQFARDKGIQIVATGDWHTYQDKEISDEPDFEATYPPHCMIGTQGAMHIPATSPREPYVISWQDEAFNPQKVLESNEIVIYKNEFDVFSGSPHTEEVLSLLNPDRIIVYGVALNVCDNFAIQGFRDRGIKTYAVMDAMKDLPHLKGTELDTERILESWKDRGVYFTNTQEILEERL